MKTKKQKINILVLFSFVIVLMGAFYYLSSGSLGEQIVNQKIDDTTPKTDIYFQHADPAVYRLARKIEKNQPIAIEEVKALPEGTLNARYGAEITLLFHALSAHNLQAIDVLLQAGADPYMVDSPESGSGRDFTYYLGTVNTSDDNKLNNEFKTELIKIYLKNGGDPNHRLPGRKAPPFINYVTLMDNFDGVEVLLKAGADPLAYDNNGNFNTVTILAGNRDERSMQIVKDIVCQGKFDHAPIDKTVDHMMAYMYPSGPSYPKQEALYKKLAMRILKYHPDYPNNNYTKNIFNGPIPWKDILAMSDKELCDE